EPGDPADRHFLRTAKNPSLKNSWLKGSTVLQPLAGGHNQEFDCVPIGDSAFRQRRPIGLINVNFVTSLLLDPLNFGSRQQLVIPFAYVPSHGRNSRSFCSRPQTNRPCQGANCLIPPLLTHAVANQHRNRTVAILSRGL